MIIGFVGLHGAGKSAYGSLLEKLFGWRWIEKRTLLHDCFYTHLLLGRQASFEQWIVELYSREGPRRVMQMILEKVLPSDTPVVIDAIHHQHECGAILDRDPAAILVGVFAPTPTRNARKRFDSQLDNRRIALWYEEGGCLISKIEWALSGACSAELQIAQCRSLAEYLNARDK